MMKQVLIISLFLFFAVACGSQTKRLDGAPQVVQPVQYTFSVKSVYPHSTDSYTQGLQYVDGEMWEGTGEWGESRLQKIDLESGADICRTRIPLESEFVQIVKLSKIYARLHNASLDRRQTVVVVNTAVRQRRVCLR